MIQKAHASDLFVISEIVQRTIGEIYPHYYPAGAVKFFQEHHSLHNIEKDIEAGNVYYLTDQGIPVSTVTINDNEINRLFVLPEFQGRGFGTLLMDFAEQRIGERFPAAILSSSFSAQDMYLHRGYTVQRFQKIQCENGDQLCFYLMQKSLCLPCRQP